MVYAAPQLSTDASGNQTVSVAVLAKDGVKTLSTTEVSAAAATAISAKLVPGNLVDWVPAAQANQVAVATDAAQTFNVVLAKGSSAAAQFAVAKYGPEVTRHKDIPGPMVAAGWVYAKSAGTITVGDGRAVLADMAGRAYATPIKRYEETYQLASDVKVFNVDTSDYGKNAASTAPTIPP